MNRIIQRTLFWFKDGETKIQSLNDNYFSLATLLNRLLNERYNGKKIKFINLDFSTEETYELHSQLPKNTSYYYGGHLRYCGLINLKEFTTLSTIEKDRLLWRKSYEFLQECAKLIKNNELSEASEYAYKRGIQMNFYRDYRQVELDTIYFGIPLKISVWINFKEDGMYSKLTIEKNGLQLFEKNIDKTKNGIEFFLEMYKSIKIEGNAILLEGRKDVDYLPLRILVDEKLIKV